MKVTRLQDNVQCLIWFTQHFSSYKKLCCLDLTPLLMFTLISLWFTGSWATWQSAIHKNGNVAQILTTLSSLDCIFSIRTKLCFPCQFPSPFLPLFFVTSFSFLPLFLFIYPSLILHSFFNLLAPPANESGSTFSASRFHWREWLFKTRGEADVVKNNF